MKYENVEALLMSWNCYAFVISRAKRLNSCQQCKRLFTVFIVACAVLFMTSKTKLRNVIEH